MTLNIKRKQTLFFKTTKTNERDYNRFLPGPSFQRPSDSKAARCRVWWTWAFQSSHRGLDKSLLSSELRLHRSWNTGSRAPPATPRRAPDYSSWSVEEEVRPGTGSEMASGSGDPGCPHTESPGSGSPRCSFWSTCSSFPLSSQRRGGGGTSWPGLASAGWRSRNPRGCCTAHSASRYPARTWWSTHSSFQQSSRQGCVPSRDACNPRHSAKIPQPSDLLHLPWLGLVQNSVLDSCCLEVLLGEGLLAFWSMQAGGLLPEGVEY